MVSIVTMINTVRHWFKQSHKPGKQARVRGHSIAPSGRGIFLTLRAGSTLLCLENLEKCR